MPLQRFEPNRSHSKRSKQLSHGDERLRRYKSQKCVRNALDGSAIYSTRQSFSPAYTKMCRLWMSGQQCHNDNRRGCLNLKHDLTYTIMIFGNWRACLKYGWTQLLGATKPGDKNKLCLNFELTRMLGINVSVSKLICA